ncbi:MAG TPA: hypothetical protein VGI85_15570 [Chthoniobacterales bacterium]|jgi:hypothetical protein
MKHQPEPIDRLLRAAATVPNEPAPPMPFGFETRVLAQWRATRTGGDLAGITRLLRRVVFMSLAVIVLGSAGAYRELSQGDGATETLSNDYAIADSAIGGVFEQ